MALSWVLPTTLLFALALANIQLSTCQVVKAKVTCLDCHQNTDFSGIKVLVKCGQVKKLAMATTEKDGSFETKLPLGNSKSPMNCLARILGGPDQLYASRKVMASEIVKTQEPNSYTISTPLGFTTSCPLNIKEAACKAMNKFGSSKTVNLPVPPEWGLAPSSYYVPFIPIIGIP
ncbi:unnamed protein product [Prunus armeniaca]|uniref:Pollen Ole e 1 allergen and extensin family protein n=1 Tax=Prunus armeniaca TaxID=36596 RepID=A0A6J5XL70_PRUAR|nr:hypothetical protein GBA52_020634 [Prunus armeniaca]CAB4313791.1 unnamed protein product [Prunus armeniaca]